MLSTDCRVRGPSPGHGVSSSESEGSSYKLIGGLQFLLFTIVSHITRALPEG